MFRRSRTVEAAPRIERPAEHRARAVENGTADCGYCWADPREAAPAAVEGEVWRCMTSVQEQRRSALGGGMDAPGGKTLREAADDELERPSPSPADPDVRHVPCGFEGDFAAAVAHALDRRHILFSGSRRMHRAERDAREVHVQPRGRR